MKNLLYVKVVNKLLNNVISKNIMIIVKKYYKFVQIVRMESKEKNFLNIQENNVFI